MKDQRADAAPARYPDTGQVASLPASFGLLWTGQSISLVGSQISDIAVRLLAATTLAATSFQLGLLAAAQTAGFLLIGLPAGVLADRVDRRRALIACDLLRAALLLTIPLAGWLGHVTFAQVLAIAFTAGLVQVVFDVSYQSFVPALVGRGQLVRANGRLESSRSSAVAAGPALGGGLVQLVGAASAILFDCLSYLASALLLWRIRGAPAAAAAGRHRSMRADIAEGLRFVTRHPLLRATTGAAALFNVCYGMMQPLVILLLVTRLHLPATVVGLLLAVAGVGGLAGGLLAGRVARLLGHARTIWIAELACPPALLLLPLAEPGARLLLFAAGYLALHVALAVFNVANLSFRQAICPDALLGRMNASVRFLMWGALPVGSLVGGVLGGLMGPRAALTVAGFALFGAAGWLLLSPLRRLRDLPGPALFAPNGNAAGGLPASAGDGQRGGAAIELIESVLGARPQYRDFRAGRLRRHDYSAWVGEHVEDLRRAGLSEDQCNLSTRFPIDERRFVETALSELCAAGVLPGAHYPEDELRRFREAVVTRFRHEGRTTYIFPEEARLLFALAHILRPRRTVFLGSYYGYWAIWAMPGIVAGGGRATLVDIDPEVLAIARRGFRAIGVADAADFVVADATRHLEGLPEVDLCVLDAEGPKDGVVDDLRDKAIYSPIARAWTPALRPGGLLVAHNMLMENLADNPYFHEKIADNLAQYADFQRHLDEHYDFQRVLATSEGVGIYRRSGAPPRGSRA